MNSIGGAYFANLVFELNVDFDRFALKFIYLALRSSG